MWLFLALVAVPLIEIALFIKVGGLIGLWPTLGLVLLSAVAGTTLMRAQGMRAWAEVQRSLASLSDPSRPLAHGALILIAGMLLLTPGFFTDSLGLLLLIPAVREAVMNRIAQRIQVVSPAGPRPRDPHRPPFEDGIIDADYTVEPDPAPPPAPHGAIPGTERRGGSGWTRH